LRGGEVAGSGILATRVDASIQNRSRHRSASMKESTLHDLIIVGAGASGMMCGIHAGAGDRSVLILEKGRKAGLKILISGGGRCNFTNVWADPRQHYLSDNRHFCISAMRRYEPAAFIDLVESAGIAYHEKKLGQLFCNDSARQIVNLLLKQCQSANVEIKLRSEVTGISPLDDGKFAVVTADETYLGRKVVIASGGLSIPKIASDLAFRTANALAIKVIPPRAALVPLLWNARDKVHFSTLSGIALDARVSCGSTDFRESILFTHRGLSGPGVLQISSYWRPGMTISIDLLPDDNAEQWFAEAREHNPQKRLVSLLKARFPNRFVDLVAEIWFEDNKLGSLSPQQLRDVARLFSEWQFQPSGTEGYRTAEVTLGGIDTNELSSKTFELKKVPGLYAIGEAVDVTGWLGGYNFQWAWASAYSCAQHLYASD